MSSNDSSEENEFNWEPSNNEQIIPNSNNINDNPFLAELERRARSNDEAEQTLINQYGDEEGRRQFEAIHYHRFSEQQHEFIEDSAMQTNQEELRLEIQEAHSELMRQRPQVESSHLADSSATTAPAAIGIDSDLKIPKTASPIVKKMTRWWHKNTAANLPQDNTNASLQDESSGESSSFHGNSNSALPPSNVTSYKTNNQNKTPKPKINLLTHTTENRPLPCGGHIVIWYWIGRIVHTWERCTGQWWMHRGPTKIHWFSKLSGGRHGLCQYTEHRTKNLCTYWRAENADPNDFDDWPIIHNQSPLHPFQIEGFATTGANQETVTWSTQDDKYNATDDSNEPTLRSNNLNQESFQPDSHILNDYSTEDNAINDSAEHQASHQDESDDNSRFSDFDSSEDINRFPSSGNSSATHNQNNQLDNENSSSSESSKEY